MPKIILSFFVIASVFTWSFFAWADITNDIGVFALRCGDNLVNVEYKISVDASKKTTHKTALLLSGTPANKFFSEDGDTAFKLADAFRSLGYQVMEIKYPTRHSYPSRLVPEGFYAACFRQGFDNIKKHSADLYDAIARKLQYEPHKPHHRLVGFGYSLGALQLQLMAFGYGKKFDHIGLTGVLLGDAANGCRLGLEYIAATERGKKKICSAKKFSEGLSYAHFMPYVQQITKSGNGCCIEESNSFGACLEGTKNEYTSQLNFENLPFFAAFSLSIFEGTQACIDRPPTNFSGANPAQAQYVADKRRAAGASTTNYFYQGCSHDVLGCAGDKALEDILHVLTRRRYNGQQSRLIMDGLEGKSSEN